MKERADIDKLNATVKDDLAGKGLVFNQPDRSRSATSCKRPASTTSGRASTASEAWALLEKAVGKLS